MKEKNARSVSSESECKETVEVCVNTNLRPGERVRQFLQTQFLAKRGKTSQRLPTISELATRLEVSRPTVQSVIAELVKEGTLQTRAGDGTYLTALPEKINRTFQLGVNALQAYSWNGHIYGGIFSAAMESANPVQICPLSVSREESADYVALFSATFPELDGYILLPPCNTVEVIQQIEKTGKPWVSFNAPSPGSVANFVAPDYYGASFTIGRALASQGRRRVLYVSTDAGQIVSSDMLRLTGLTNGLQSITRDAQIRVERLEATTQQESYALIERLVQSKDWFPDAVYCMGDYLALGCAEALGEFDFDVPEEVSVIGGSGMNLHTFARPDITRMDMAFHRVGQELIQMMIRRLQFGGAEQTGVYVPTGFFGFGTTSEHENELLQAETHHLDKANKC